MRTLIIGTGLRNNTSRLYIDFKLRLTEFCEVFVYEKSGPKLNGEKISPLEYNQDLSIKEICSEIKPDIILLPEYPIIKKFNFNFKQIDIPIVIEEVDYYELEDQNWYLDNNISFVMYRAPDVKTVIPSVWIPWSADEDLYTDINSNYLDNRINYITFVGGGRFSLNPYYKVRQKAIKILEKNKVLDYVGSVDSSIYPKTLKTYISALSCSFPPLHKAPAKVFEIMASGTLLLTTKIDSKERLFGKNRCFIEYEEDCSNILYKSMEILDMSVEELYSITRNSLSIINKYHLHGHRIKEIYNLFTDILSGKEIIDRWNVDGIYSK